MLLIVPSLEECTVCNSSLIFNLKPSVSKALNLVDCATRLPSDECIRASLTPSSSSLMLSMKLFTEWESYSVNSHFSFAVGNGIETTGWPRFSSTSRSAISQIVWLNA